MAQTAYIYWLLDMRPETIAAGWHSGYPFYCGKTVRPSQRLNQHVNKAKVNPNNKKSKRLLLCGRHVRLLVVETVAPGVKWRVRERHWIKVLRFSFPDNCNISDGGEDRTPQQRRKHRKTMLNSKRSRMVAIRRRLEAIENRRNSKANMSMRIRAHRKYLQSLQQK